MRIDKMTTKAQEAVRTAVELAAVETPSFTRSTCSARSWIRRAASAVL
jgi:hypothetical protein